MTRHPDAFDELIHSSIRLRICAALATATALEFTAIEDALEISTSTLSKQLKVLGEAGYVTLDVYVCNYSTNNRPKAQKLFDVIQTAFSPSDPHLHRVERA